VRRVPNVYRRVHFSAQHTARWVGLLFPLLCSPAYTGFDNSQCLHLQTGFPDSLYGNFSLPTYGLLVLWACYRDYGQRGAIGEAGNNGVRAGIWESSYVSVESWAQKFFILPMTGATTEPCGENFQLRTLQAGAFSRRVIAGFLLRHGTSAAAHAPALRPATRSLQLAFGTRSDAWVVLLRAAGYGNDRVVLGRSSSFWSRSSKLIFNRDRDGYRPKRTGHQAVNRVAQAIVESKTRIIDIDLRAYFE